MYHFANLNARHLLLKLIFFDRLMRLGLVFLVLPAVRVLQELLISLLFEEGFVFFSAQALQGIQN